MDLRHLADEFAGCSAARVEEAVLDIVARAAIRSGATHLVGTYLPTAKNALVAHHFEKLGFTSLPGDGMAPRIGRWRSRIALP